MFVAGFEPTLHSSQLHLFVYVAMFSGTLRSRLRESLARRASSQEVEPKRSPMQFADSPSESGHPREILRRADTARDAASLGGIAEAEADVSRVPDDAEVHAGISSPKSRTAAGVHGD